MSELYRVKWSGVAASQVIQNTLWVLHGNTGPSVTDATSIANAAFSAYLTTIVPHLSSSYSYTGVDVVSYTNPTIGTFIGGSGTGGITGLSNATYVTAKVHFRTGQRQAGNRARWTLGPLGESDTTGNTLVSSSQTGINNAVGNFLNGMTSVSPVFGPVAVSLVSHKVPRPSPLIFGIIGHDVSLVLGTQLLRKRRI